MPHEKLIRPMTVGGLFSERGTWSVMTLDQVVEATPDVRYREAVASLDLHEQSMLRALEEDLDVAKRFNRPPATKLRILHRRKERISFYILPTRTTFAEGLKRQGIFKSHLELEANGVVTLELLHKLFGIMKLKGDATGHCINGLTHSPATGADGESYSYYYDCVSA